MTIAGNFDDISHLSSSPGRVRPGDPIVVEGTQVSAERQFYVYIMASRPWGTLYIGITNDLFRRVFEHKAGLIEGFTKKYGVKTLVYVEEWVTASEAIHREKRLKKWTRTWKITLIRANNPDWKDLADEWYPKAMSATEMETWLTKIAAQ